MFNIYKNASPTSTTWIATSSATSGSEMTAGKRRAAGGILTSLTPTHVTTSGSRKFLLAVALFVLLASVNGATDQKTVKPSPTSPLSSSSASLSATPKDEIYIDDESIEGSGGRGGLHDDLDKDPDYSGSGFGPDDEDSSTDLQPSHRGNNIHTQSGKHNTVLTTDDNDDLITSRTHHQTNSGTIIGSNSGSNSGIIGGNSGSNTGLNTIGGTTNQGNTIHELDTNNVNSQPTDTKVIEHTTGNEVLIMNTSDDDRTASFFAQPGILAAVIGGAVVGLLCAILVVMFIVYRMRKKDEGSYALDEPKRSPAVNSYAKNANNREFYA
ncbi:syndecan isoform X4 [Bactrocera dorsalis]|uniref:Syndecan n=1 Tax=Bactrocera dorsalis TaxID=27457 RepID=A0A034VMG7_BACDO|nr:syndecan isoform X4 [Bactrocera dorsalis]